MISKHKRYNSCQVYITYLVYTEGSTVFPKPWVHTPRPWPSRQDGHSPFLLAGPTLVTVVRLLHTGQLFAFNSNAQSTYHSSSSHVGSVPGRNLEFDGFLGPDEWGSSVIAKWDTFLHSVYRMWLLNLLLLITYLISSGGLTSTIHILPWRNASAYRRITCTSFQGWSGRGG